MVENQGLNEQKNCSAVRPLDDSELRSLSNAHPPDKQDALCLLSVFDRPGHDGWGYPVNAEKVEAFRNTTLPSEDLGKWTALTRLQDNLNRVGHQDGWDEKGHIVGKVIMHDLVPSYALSREDLERIVQGQR